MRQGETVILLSLTDTLYLFEFYRICKVGGIASPYAKIEWPGVQIPQALTAILQGKAYTSSVSTTMENFRRHPSTSTREIQPDADSTSTSS